MYTVYRHTNVISGKSYVGYTSKSMYERWLAHLKKAKKGSYHFHLAIKCYPITSWKHDVLDVIVDPIVAKQKEIEWIAKFRSSEHAHGYNSTKGGDGLIVNERTRQKMSDAHKGQTPWNKGRSASTEARQNMSASHLGKKAPWNARPRSQEEKDHLRQKCSGRRHTKEEIERQITAQTGRKFSEETKAKLRRPRSEETKEKMRLAWIVRRLRSNSV